MLTIAMLEVYIITGTYRFRFVYLKLLHMAGNVCGIDKASSQHSHLSARSLTSVAQTITL